MTAVILSEVFLKRGRVRAEDGLEIPVYTSLPEGKGPFPFVVDVSGGKFGGYRLEDGSLDPLIRNTSRFLTENGFGLLVVEKRGSKGYGREFQERREIGGREVGDIVCGAEHLRSKGFAREIILHASCSSAFSGALAVEKSELFSCAIFNLGFFDLKKEYEWEAREREKMPIEQVFDKKEIQAMDLERRSPINYVGKIECPVLLVTGLSDTILSPERTREFFLELVRCKKEAEMIIYEDFPHEKASNDPSTKKGERYWGDVLTFTRKRLA